ncbi:MAG: 5,10-methylenetetrahydromethanopterin reductase [Solirubrobacterales bacterium]|jgi:5,10-methylenetetrahydromethanopterin reductase|nr:5,10-methylenetetrahydromethanopterin reductase [Solirubrobacterales bacterium]
MLLADSQNLNTEIWVELGLAAASTETLKLGPGVTNPVTRHPSVTASAAATLQVESGGRAVLALGRGDSALRQIGREPVHPSELEEALIAIQAYLRGEPATVDGFESRLAWLEGAEVAKVPVIVAASGPHVIEAGARHAEGVDFTVGAEPERLRWAAETARAAGSPSLGAFVNVAVDDDPAVARDLVRGSAAIFARFSAEGSPDDGLSEVTRAGIESIAATYDESKHGQASAVHSQALDDEFIERFAVAGTADQVAERLAAIGELGIERLVIVPCSLDTPAEALERSNERFAADVLPRLR